jgi:ATP-binding cassette subfamily F protein 3
MLSFTKLSLRRGKKELFKEVTLNINPKTKVGLTGANGTGKTSFIKLILGELQADTGDFFIPKKFLIAHVEQEIIHLDKSAIDFVIDGDKEFRELESTLNQAEKNNDSNNLGELYEQMNHIEGYTINARASKLLNGLGFSSEQEQNPINSFSGGWRMRLNLAQALMSRSDILLLDEPTNHLDLEAIS